MGVYGICQRSAGDGIRREIILEMKCVKCGRELANGSTICTFCGYKNDAKSFFYTVKDESSSAGSFTNDSLDYEPVRREPPRPEPPRPEPIRREPPRPEPVAATNGAAVASKGLGTGAIILIVGAVLVSLVVGVFAFKFLAKDPIIGTWTATELVENGVSYSPEEVFEANLKASFGDSNTLILEQVGTTSSMYDSSINGKWDKTGKGEYTATIYGEFGETVSSAVHIKGKTLIWDGVGGSYIVFEK